MIIVYTQLKRSTLMHKYERALLQMIKVVSAYRGNKYVEATYKDILEEAKQALKNKDVYKMKKILKSYRR